jgi:spore coat protein CotF
MDMNMRNEAPQRTIQGGTVQLNHGGHEVMDVHELLGGAINILNQYMVHRQFVRDQELLKIIDRQYQFIADEYNMIQQAFSTGQDPAHGTKRYQMTQSNETIAYGMQSSSPKKPIQSLNEMSDQQVAAHMIGLLKAAASAKTMAAFETTNPVVRRVIQDSIPNCLEMAYEIFLWQNKRGYYQVPQFTEQDTRMMQQAFAPATINTRMQ